MTNQIVKSDILGSISSLLCLIHCIASPFILIGLSSAVYNNTGLASWWGMLDFIFLAISFYAVYISAKQSSKKLVSFGLWFSWLFMFAIIANEKIGLLELVEEIIYLPSLALVFLHIYNLKYCTCKESECCVA